MATTTSFEQTIKDKKADKKIELEFGRSSFYGESLIYFKVDGKSVIVDEATGRKIYEAMDQLGGYLGYDK